MEKINVDGSFFPENISFYTQVVDNNSVLTDVHYHTHTFYELVFIIFGSVGHRVGSKMMMLQAGDVVLLPPGVYHQFLRTQDTICTHRDMLFKRELFDRICSRYYPELAKEMAKTSAFKLYHLNEEQINILQYCVDCFVNGDAEADYLNSVSEALLNNLLLFSHPSYAFSEKDIARKPYPAYIDTLIRAIKNNDALDMSTEELLMLTGHSKEHVRRMFKKCTGKTITEYMDEQKLQYTVTLLTDTRLSIKQILSKVHASSHTHFNSLFKQKYGVTPSEYRRRWSIFTMP